MKTLSPTLREKREALKEVLESETFFRADQLRNFLRYICEMELAGRGDQLCETLIGIEAFGRPPDYSPSEDASVRRRAGDLREKLVEVYAKELSGSKVRIELPKGKFVPRFVCSTGENGSKPGALARYASESQLAIEPAGAHWNDALPGQRGTSIQTPSNEPKRSSGNRVITFVTGFVLGALTVLLCLAVFYRLWPQRQASATTAATTLPADAIAMPAAHTLEPGASYEAEASDNTMGGITQSYPCMWCSGGARVRNIGKSKQNQLTINNVEVAKDGNYELVICYLLKGERTFFVQVNGGIPLKLPLSGKSWFQVAKTSLSVPLKAGANMVKFYNEHDYAPDLDRIIIR